MENKKVVIGKLEKHNPISVVFKGVMFEVCPYIGIHDRMLLASAYVFSLEDKIDIAQAYYVAEGGLIYGVLDLCTNINISSDDGNSYLFDVDEIVGSGLWDLIVSKIENFSELKDEIQEVIRLKSNMDIVENSVGFVLSGVLNRVESILSQLNIEGMDVEKISKIVTDFNKGVSKLEKTVSSDVQKEVAVATRGRKRKDF